MKASLFILSLLLPVTALAEEKPSLMFDGGMSSLIALKDNFLIEYSDQVSGGCLPRPSKLKDKMELSLRQSGFSIATEESFFPNRVLITALGFSYNEYVCSVYVEAKLIFFASVSVPYAQNMRDGNHTFVPLTYEFGNTLLTGPKNGMQERIEKAVKEFGDNLYLDISRAKDKLSDDFPEILEYYNEETSSDD